ncbi:MAG TPA: DUF2378 family protein, partial [Myxococcaceae bacterium]|nr:DUF2378 family protein [Myxococcaceae bacterium]
SGQPLHLIHRDVSPQNILVGFNGSVKLIDFGVAKAAGKISTTMTGAIKGKYAYMSPEQARGEEDLDLRSDVFGLGVVFYELLTNMRLFKRESDNATLRAVIGAKITPPSQVLKGIPKALDVIVLKALARKRNERFHTAGEFLLTLEDFLVRQRLPSTNAQLAAFMQELYAEQVQERLVSEPTRGSQGQSAGRVPTELQRPQSKLPAPRPPATPAQRSGSRDAPRPARPAAPPPPAEHTASLTRPSDWGRGGNPARSKSASSARPKEPSASESGYYTASAGRGLPVESSALLARREGLDARLGFTAASDMTQGLLFNAILSLVAHQKGADIEADVRSAALDPQPYRDDFAYRTSDFLRILWHSAQSLTPEGSPLDPAFETLGMASMDAILRSSLGNRLGQVTEGRDGQRFLSPILTALRNVVAPGERKVDSVASRSAHVVHKKDVLPAAFYRGVITRAFSKLKNTHIRVELEAQSLESMRYRVLW